MLEERRKPVSPPEARALDLSILIVTWNSERFIERCLRSIPAACEGLEYEVVIHDNASADATLRGIGGGQAILPVQNNEEDGQAGLPVLHVLRSATNDGFAAGTNRALAASHGRYVFLLNPDCELAPRALTLLYEFLESHPRIAGAVPLLVGDQGEVQRDFQLRRLPTLGTLAAEVLLFDKVFPRNPATSRYRYRDLDLTEPRRIEQPAAAAILLRRAVVDAVGPFDEQFTPAWFEDVDYCRRLAERGQEIWVVPAARARHSGGASLEHMHYAGFVDIWYRNMWRYATKWLRPGQTEALRWTIIAGMLMRCAAGLIGLHPAGVERAEAQRAYAGVLKKAFHRWHDSSASSS